MLIVTEAMTALCGIFCFSLWVAAHNYAVLLLFALLSGTVTGIFWGTIAPVTAEVVGLQRMPRSFGMIVLPLVVPTVFAEPIALHLASSSGYLTAKLFVGTMYICGAISMLALRSWKICDIENKETREREGGDSSHRNNRPDKRWLTPRRLFKNRRV